MKKLALIFLISFVVYSCSKSENSTTPPVVTKLSGCDSIKQGLLKTTSDTVRLASCLTLSANDSMRLGLLKIGQPYQGGVIAYFLVPGDPGYDANIKHGLIATVANISSNAPWQCGGKIISVPVGTAIGTGNQNTINIMAACPVVDIAARLCGDLVQGGYSDWYLPSKDELNKLWINRPAIGGFSTLSYWSSTMSGSNLAWEQNFSNGDQNPSPQNGALNVRAIRAF
jgi:hypothetical protein